jgi:hypothetical protein
MAQRCGYPFSAGTNMFEVHISIFFCLFLVWISNPKLFHLQFYADIELMIGEGGGGTKYFITCCRDTGSDALTLFDSDWQFLGNLDNYIGYGQFTFCWYGNRAPEYLPFISVRMRLVNPDGTPWVPRGLRVLLSVLSDRRCRDSVSQGKDQKIRGISTWALAQIVKFL